MAARRLTGGVLGAAVFFLLSVVCTGSTEDVKVVNAPVGATVQLQLSYSGEATAYTWTKGDKRVADWDSPLTVTYYDTLEGRCDLNTSTGALTIRGLQERDATSYRGEALVGNLYIVSNFHLRVFVDAASTSQQVDDTNLFEDLDDNLPSIDTDTLEEVISTIRSPTPPPERDNVVEPQPPPSPESATTNMSTEWENTQLEFQRTAVALQRELLREVHVAVDSIGGILQAILRSMNPDLANIGTEQASNTQTTGLAQSLANISNIMSQRHVQMPPQSATRDVAQHLQNIDERMRDMQQRQDLYMATMTAFHGELLTVIKNQQLMLNALMANIISPEHVFPQTSSATDGGSSGTTRPAATEPTKPQSDDFEDDLPTQFRRKTGH